MSFNEPQFGFSSDEKAAYDAIKHEAECEGSEIEPEWGDQLPEDWNDDDNFVDDDLDNNDLDYYEPFNDTDNIHHHDSDEDY